MFVWQLNCKVARNNSYNNRTTIAVQKRDIVVVTHIYVTHEVYVSVSV